METLLVYMFVFVILIVVILGGLYQKVWYHFRKVSRHNQNVEQLLSQIRDAVKARRSGCGADE
jgi:hypothetical protein